MGTAALAILVLSVLASTQAVTAGVKAGNKFNYKINQISGTGMGNAVNFTVEVSGFSSNGSVVYLNQTAGYPSGSNSTWSTGYTNIEMFDPYETIWFLTSANLKADDTVWSGWPIWINGTKTVGGRPTNYVTLNKASINITNVTQGYVTGYMYWNQATGVPINVSISLTSTSQNSSFSYILTYSSVWTVPEFSPMAFALFTFTLTSATVAIAYHEKARVRKKAMLLVT